MIDKSSLVKVSHPIFLENGYKNTNISEIARSSGIAVGSFYKFYQSKEEIFLDVYIKENNRIRNHLIERVNWDAEPVEVIDELFDYILNFILSNNILIEWNNPSISKTLQNYYYSETGLSNYSFHHFLLNTLQDRLKEVGIKDDVIKEISKVYDLIYYIDCHITDNDFENYSETLRILIKYFIKGIFS